MANAVKLGFGYISALPKVYQLQLRLNEMNHFNSSIFQLVTFCDGWTEFQVQSAKRPPVSTKWCLGPFFLLNVHGNNPSDWLKTRFYPMRMVLGPNVMYYSQFLYFKQNCYVSSKLESRCGIPIQASHLKYHAPKVIPGTLMTSKSIITYKYIAIF